MPKELMDIAFDWENQNAFAAFSGDSNPIHMDEHYARHTQPGAPIVHGMYVVLIVLDRLFFIGYLSHRSFSVSCQFQKFIFMGQRAQVLILSQSDRGLALVVKVENQVAYKFNIRFELSGKYEPEDSFVVPDIELGSSPLVHELSELPGLYGRLGPVKNAADRAHQMFPNLAQWLSAETIQSISLISTLVGMVVPGLYSLLVETYFDIYPHSKPCTGLSFAVDSFNEQYRLLEMSVSGAQLKGRVCAFVREKEFEPPQIARVQDCIQSDEFAHQSALVVGGARGLGAVTAMLLACGGAHVVLTYKNSRAKAEELATQLNRATQSDRCHAVYYDAETSEPIENLPVSLSHLYYFATPKIHRQKNYNFNPIIFNEFYNIYILGFMRLFEHIYKEGKSLTVVNPSTSDLTVRNRVNIEYIMAKTALEQLCTHIDKYWPEVRVFSPRLPRVKTDQTEIVPPVAAADPVDILLPLLRSYI